MYNQKVTRLRQKGMEVQCTQVEQRDHISVKPKEKYALGNITKRATKYEI